MTDPTIAAQPLNEQLKQRVPAIPVTYFLITANLLVFLAMLLSGAGFLHSPNAVQLAWGANFGPATQDGQWWRLGTAMFLHFGVIHLLMNMGALWDGGRLVERMYGHARFIVIYISSGLAGNLFSLVIQGNQAVSGGASGAIFGVYGALLAFLWLERSSLDAQEFRWMFWGAAVFSGVIILLGFVVPGIDNSAHIGGFVAGILAGIVFNGPLSSPLRLGSRRVVALAAFISGIVLLITHIPLAPYRWRDEVQVRKQIKQFLQEDQAVNRNWLEILNEGKQGDASFDELAGRIDTDVADHYAESFEELSNLPLNPAMPSAKTLENTMQYAQKKRDASRALAEKLRAKADTEKAKP